ncbi:down syndrome cell adhesion molecule [Trichonephila clavipes]|nr:down syndrome cell adhesion molecule [Trichonephila clavipes]
MKEGLIASSYECPKCNDQYDVTWSAIKRFLRNRASHAESPVAASEQSFITRNATTFILRLSAWKSGGCPILFFVIQYKQQRQLDWNVLSPRIEPEEEYAKITNLTPSTWYSILVTAHNNAGPTEVEYVTSTLTLQGGTIEPEIVGEKEQLRKYKSLSIIVPVSCAVIVLIAVSLAVFFLVCKKRGTRLTNHYEGVRGNEEGKSDALAMADLEKTYDQNRESVYFPSPYATSRVPGLHRDEVGLERDGCRSLHHHSGRQSDHLYDIPQQMRDDMVSGFLWNLSFIFEVIISLGVLRGRVNLN